MIKKIITDETHKPIKIWTDDVEVEVEYLELIKDEYADK